MPVLVGIKPDLGMPALPQETVDTTYSLPTGTTYTVGSDPGDDFTVAQLQTALDTAVPGDVVVLRATDTFQASTPYRLKEKNNPDNKWIYVISSQLDSLPESQRVSPADAANMPTMIATGTDPIVATNFAADHWRLSGIEIQTSVFNYGIVMFGYGTTPDTEPWFNRTVASNVDKLPNNIIVDRCYLHSTSDSSCRRGIYLDGEHMACIDSYLSNFKDSGSDSQAIWTFNMSGPIKIENNYLEGAGENYMAGGTDSPIQDGVPHDIEFLRNHCFKRLSWKADDPSYGGNAYVVKNLFELKNARRVYVAGNVFENNWAASQDGKGILFTVRNQQGNAPWSVVEDVTFENNKVLNSYSGFNIPGTDDLQNSETTKRLHIRNNLLQNQYWSCAYGSTAGKYTIEGCRMENNTIIHQAADGTWLVGYIVLASVEGTNVYDRFVFKNNICGYGRYGTGAWASVDAPGVEWELNGLIYNPASDRHDYEYGKRNEFNPKDLYTTNINGFVDYEGGNYRLEPTSPFYQAGSDGKDCGCDWDELDAATNGVV